MAAGPELHIERDIKLAVPASFRLPKLARFGTVQPAPTRRSITTFYDTTELALAAWGCLLRYRTSDGWTVKLPDIGAGAGLERPEIVFGGAKGGPPEETLEVLSAFLRGRAVAPVARLEAIRRRFTFVDGAGNALVDLVDDRVTTREQPPRRMRQVELELKAPAAADLLAEIVDALVDAGAQAGDRRTKYGWTLGARVPPPEIPVPPVNARSMAGDVVRAGLSSGVDQLIRRDAEIRGGRDPEAVHQARVATRRIRSDLRTFRAILDGAWAKRLRGELGWFGGLLGEVRDREVLAARLRTQRTVLPDADAITPVLANLDGEIDRVREELRAEMRGARYRRLVDDLVTAAQGPVLSVADGPAAPQLRPAMDRAWKRLRRARRAARGADDSELLHAVRIAAKRVRYTSEALAPVFGKRASRLAVRAEALQDVLGEHQDAVVAHQWLREHADVDGIGSAFAVGELAAVQLQAGDRARSRWVKAWKSLRRWRPATWR